MIYLVNWGMEKKIPMTKTEWHSVRREKKLCLYCNTTVNSKPLCKPCQEKKNLWRKTQKQKWIDANLCVECGNERFGNKLICESHYFKSVSRRWLGSSFLWKEIKEMLDGQSYRCALTDDLLTPDNMELDHVVSLSSGGENLLANVRWVTRDANRAKQHLTDHELLVLCKKIVKHLT
jgi:hypothetical protein